jgi:glycosyltransferase involved in cell wall biosynthesis
MHIVHIEDFFHPDAGYQINILSKYQVKQGHKVTVVSSEISKIPEKLRSFFGFSDIQERDSVFCELNSVNVVRLPIFGYYSGRSIYSFKFFRVIKSLNPDILYVHGNDSFAGIVCTLFHKKLRFPLIMDSHMLEMAASNKFSQVFYWAYRRFVKNIIIKNKIRVIRVHNDNFVIKNLGIPNYLAPIILHGTDTIQFHPNPSRSDEVRSIYRIGINDFVVLYMGKLTVDKGVLLLANACKVKFEIPKRVILVIVGNTSSEYGIKVEEELKLCENKVLRFPTQKYPDLPDFYHLSDVAIFPRHCSLSFYDAQACGVPVILEDNSVNIDRIIMHNGLIFKSGDYKDLREKIRFMAEMSDSELIQMKQASVKYISSNNLDYENIADQYERVIKESVREFII